MRHKLFQNFWENVVIIPEHSCWEWIGMIDEKGYGRYHLGDNKYAKAHRYMLAKSEKLNPKLMVDHICRNRSCVNPKHLRQVTAKINAIENSASIPAHNVTKTHCIRGHAYDKANTILRKNGNRRCRECKLIANAEYKSRNKSAISAYRKKRYAKNKKFLSAYYKERYARAKNKTATEAEAFL